MDLGGDSVWGNDPEEIKEALPVWRRSDDAILAAGHFKSASGPFVCFPGTVQIPGMKAIPYRILRSTSPTPVPGSCSGRQKRTDTNPGDWFIDVYSNCTVVRATPSWKL